MDMAPLLRTRLLMLLSENLQKTGDTTKAKQSLNQAFLVSAEIEEAALKIELQKMIRESLENL